MGKALKKEVRQHLVKILDMTPGTIAARLSEIKREHYGITPAAAAQLLARKHGKSIQRFLTDDDRKSLVNVYPTANGSTRVLIRRPSGRRVSVRIILSFSTSDRFIQKHIEEINGTYNARCYTATFILCRKVMENLIIEILRKKFPRERKLYEDNATHRFLDFSIVLDNLYAKRAKLNAKAYGAIERLKQKAMPFKKDANDKTHSLFHIAGKKEIDEAEVQLIFDLISTIMVEVGT